LLSKLNAEEILDLSAFATNLDGEKIPVRICAKRKTPEAAARTPKKLKRQESKIQLVITDETKAFNNYFIVITNLGETVPAQDILEVYRLRWQVEICFKRLKSILDFGELPKHSACGAKPATH